MCLLTKDFIIIVKAADAELSVPHLFSTIYRYFPALSYGSKPPIMVGSGVIGGLRMDDGVGVCVGLGVAVAVGAEVGVVA
jgi:hypothetical protein